VSFQWTEECQQAFEVLKNRLATAPVLAYSRVHEQFVVETDASIHGLDAVLAQEKDGKLHPVAYASHALTPGERSYGITELETLAVVWAVTYFRTYLYGLSVVVYADHFDVKTGLLDSHASGKRAKRWSRVFNSGLKVIDIVYRPGKKNGSADALSCSPQASAPTEGLGESEVQSCSVRQVCLLPVLICLVRSLARRLS